MTTVWLRPVSQDGRFTAVVYLCYMHQQHGSVSVYVNNCGQIEPETPMLALPGKPNCRPQNGSLQANVTATPPTLCAQFLTFNNCAMDIHCVRTLKQTEWLINGAMHRFHSLLIKGGQPYWMASLRSSRFLRLSDLKF